MSLLTECSGVLAHESRYRAFDSGFLIEKTLA
jgi:hypothetical protein